MVLLVLIAVLPESILRRLNPVLAPFFGMVGTSRDESGCTLNVPQSAHLGCARGTAVASDHRLEPHVRRPPATQHLTFARSTAFDAFPFLFLRPMHVLVDKGFFESSSLARKARRVRSTAQMLTPLSLVLQRGARYCARS